MDVGLVCDACSALTPIGVPQCARCGEPVALDPRRAKKVSGGPGVVAAGKPAVVATSCPKCGTAVTPGLRFCPSCGQNLVTPQRPLDHFDVETKVGPRTNDSKPTDGQKAGRSTLFFGGALQAARAKLTLIRGDGEDGVSFTLAGTDHVAGRGECPISFPDDPYLSPMHCNFRYADGKLVVRDQGSLNGVYIRITGTRKIEIDTTILVGEQVLTAGVPKAVEDLPDGEGTYYSASMLRPAILEVTQQLRGGSTAWVFRPVGDTATLGREGNDINFPDDPFISGRHAQLRFAEGVLSITDLGSRNGTFVRILNEEALRHGDYVFLGQQLLRVEIV
jgi:pSer/pThr/pTyr-binding forkhead associated (FHA) protein/ribosomal protein L40E